MQLEESVMTGWDAATRADYQPTVNYFEDLLARYPDDPRALFEMARAWDWSGQSDKAAPYYERAFAAGLARPGRRPAQRGMLQYGSTVRNLDRPAEAVEVLERARVMFPDSEAVRAFLALALLSDGRADDAVAEPLDFALDRVPCADFERYNWALRHYAAALRRGYWSASDDDGRTPA